MAERMSHHYPPSADTTHDNAGLKPSAHIAEGDS
jgi:hypothetical protein